MKSVLFLTLSFLLVGSIYAESPNATLFDINEDLVEAQVADLTNLENYVLANEGVTLNEVRNFVSDEDLNLSENMLDNFAAVMADHPVAGIPSFLWGCVLGPVGVAIVHFSEENKEETKKALWGCGAYGLVIVAYWVLIYATWAPFYY
ncbi:MAG: hypothetical protein WD431_15700 [Cyclobacteriaceae bacterium]